MAFTPVTKLETAVPTAQAREADFKKLVAQGYISGHATRDKTRERVELKRDLATQRETLTTLKASVVGVAQQLAIHTTGAVTEAQALMIIASEGPQFTVEVTLENKDVGFVNVCNGAEIKLETFPSMRRVTVQASGISLRPAPSTTKNEARFFR